MPFADAFDAKRNSIGAIRLFCALAVIVGHAHPFGGYGDTFTMLLTNQQVSGARVAVDVFFVLSGFLLISSIERLTLLEYIRNRVLRIFPALWVCVILTGILTPIAFGVAPGWQYVWKNATLLAGTHNQIPGLFENNIYRGPNGALWTLPWELYCYISLPVLMLAGRWKKWIALLVFLALWAQFSATIASTSDLADKRAITSPVRLFTFFYSGVVIYLYRDKIPSDWKIACSLAAFLACATALGTRTFEHAGGLFYVVAPITLGYIVLYAAVTLPLTRLNVRTDISYGLYIYGTFVIQCLVALGIHERLSYLFFSFLSVLITVPIALASWHLIEKPSLGLKTRLNLLGGVQTLSQKNVPADASRSRPERS